MKLLTPQQEQEHYSNVLKGGWGGLIGGTAVGALGVWAAGRKFPAVRNLCAPFRAFLVTSTGSFAAIIYADRWSRGYEASKNPDSEYTQAQKILKKQIQVAKPQSQRLTEWATANKYRIVLGSWVVSMAATLSYINRNPYFSRSQKLVQARIYAQGITLAVVVATLALEARDGLEREQTLQVLDGVQNIKRERYPGQNRWMDMVAAGERRMKEREEQGQHM